MSLRRKRSNAQLFILVSFIACLLIIWRVEQHEDWKQHLPRPGQLSLKRTGTSKWAMLREHYPVRKYIPMPKGEPRQLPSVQHEFSPENRVDKEERERRRIAVRQVFIKCWDSYKARAWGRDELAPISGSAKDTFGGWAATLIDSLDTLWIMNLKDEFKDAVEQAITVDFTVPNQEEINVFETNIRHLGGFLSAYDLSGDHRLLKKAIEVGEMLYKAFDTPNRMPVTRWKPQQALNGAEQEADEGTLVAEIGSLVLEFTRLSQLTGNTKWYDAVQTITRHFANQQRHTKLPGLWPVVVDGKAINFTNDNGFTLSAMADSFYEYFPKTFALLGGQEPVYQSLYEMAMQTANRYLIFRPMLPDDADVLFSGNSRVEDHQSYLEPEGQHLGCFTGGMLALGGRLFNLPEHVEIGKKLTEGCIWAYEHAPLGIMPEKFMLAACADKTDCSWNEEQYLLEVAKHAVEDENDPDRSVQQIFEQDRLTLGFTAISDRRYILRPEAIESVFMLYRVTGARRYQDVAWKMFSAINQATETELANAALADVTVNQDPPKEDSMESFWMAETLKYFYLVFSEPEVINLDEWVLNTEAHPFRRRT